MADNLRPDKYKILAVTEESGQPVPVGINHTKLAVQNIRLNEPVQIWDFREVGPLCYQLSLEGYRYTGVENGMVTVSIYPDIDAQWVITYIEQYDAFTIGLARNPSLVWTVVTEFSPFPHIVLRKIRPDYKNQLFHFDRVDE